MKTGISIILLFWVITLAGQPSPQSKKMTEKFFPDPEMVIETPAFQKKKGFTSYEELMSFLQKKVAVHPDIITLSFIGNSQKGKAIPMIKINHPGGKDRKVRVWLQGGLHGDEPASTEGLLFLLDQILGDPRYKHLLESIEIAMVPMANIDGYEKQNRYAANGLDLNRDQTKLMAPETKFLKEAFNAFDPEVAVDFHEYRAFRRDFTKMSTYGVANLYDVMFLYSGNHNVPENLRNYTRERFVQNAMTAMDSIGLSHHDYFSTAQNFGAVYFSQGSLHARSSATSYALTNAVSSLIEVRGVGLGRTSFVRRVNTTFQIALSYLNTATDHTEELREEIRKANHSPNPLAVVKMERHETQESLPMIDIETNEIITLEVKVQDAWYATPALTRPRPYAYLILPGNEALIIRLETLGIAVEKLQSPMELDVTTYVVKSHISDPEKDEGVFRQTVTTDTNIIRKDFPEGTSVIYLNQPHGNLTVELLEPEAPNSFVSFAVLETSEGAELPIYRYLTQKKL